MIQILSEEVSIERPVRDVFDFIVDMENYPRFFPGVAEMKSIDEKPAGTPGKQYREVVRIPILGDEVAIVEVAECIPGHRMSVQTDLAPARPLFEYTCTEIAPGRTRFTWNCRARSGSIYVRLLYGPMMRATMRRRAEQAMKNLKRILEATKTETVAA